jgi:ankyrin repeat protein
VLGSDLYNACTGHDFDEAKALVKRGADVNYETDPGSDTPLMAAVDSKDVRMVSFLIQDWANVSHVDDDGHSVLWHARLSPVITKMLKEAGAAR